MRVSLAILAYLAQTGLASIQKRACVADNCARAVTGTRRGPSHTLTASSDCSSFLHETTTIPLSLTTIELTETRTVTLPLEDEGLAKRAEPSPTTTSKAIPSYASACSGAVRYSSACACLGITAFTTTVADEVATITRTNYIYTTTYAQVSSTPTSTYDPPVPTSYSECLVDPENTSEIELIDQETGISFINVNGRAKLATDTVDDLTTFKFATAPNAPKYVFDLVSNAGEVLALFEDGHIGFVGTSSNGQTYVSDGSGGQYVTTIWSMTCEGDLVAGIVGGKQYQLGVVDDELYAQDYDPALKKRALRPLITFVKVVIFALEIRTKLGLDQPRCPNPDLHAVVKWGSREPWANGCGSQGFMWNYRPLLPCCMDHDYCWGDCKDTFKRCNDAFGTCNFGRCASEFPGNDILSRVKRMGCERVAATFTWIVKSEIGRKVFDIATKEHCACCKAGEQHCQSGCANLQTDPNNCGTCGNVCSGANSQCQNGVCSTSACDGAVCGGFANCGASSSCYCFTTADRTGFCAQGDMSCSGLADCATNADCGPGSICAVGSCCGRNVCLPINCANPQMKLLRLARLARRAAAAAAEGEAGHFEASTPSSPGVWVKDE